MPPPIVVCPWDPSPPTPGAGAALAAELLGADDPVALLRAETPGTPAGALAGLLLVAVRELDAHHRSYREALAAGRTRGAAACDVSALAVFAERCAVATAWLARLVAVYRSTGRPAPEATPPHDRWSPAA